MQKIQERKRSLLIVFDAMISDMISNEKLTVVTELFIRGWKLNISLAFIMQTHFKVSENARLGSTYYFIMKIPSKRKLQQIAINHLSDIDFKDFMQKIILF